MPLVHAEPDWDPRAHAAADTGAELCLAGTHVLRPKFST